MSVDKPVRPASEVAKDIAKSVLISSDLRGSEALIERDRQEVRAAALEEAAQTCESLVNKEAGVGGACLYAASLIRALATRSTEERS